jgi:hypothetical protein
MALILLVPVAIHIIAVLQWRGWMRWLATIPLAAVSVACVMDLYAATQSSNLTGLFTIIVGFMGLVSLLLIAIANFFVEVVRTRGEKVSSR